MSIRFPILMLAFGLVACTDGPSKLDPSSAVAKVDGENLSGAIFTTTSDGTVVNENVHYDAKCDVYINGGPGPGNQAGLPEGDYFFMVTDPPGKVLLSTDPVVNRQFHIDTSGNITGVSGAGNHQTSPNTVDGPPFVVIQLCPFDDSPNNGDEYKVTVTRIEDFDPDGNGAKHGFVPADSKTDNFKVRLAVNAGVPDAEVPGPDAEVPGPDAEVPDAAPPGPDAEVPDAAPQPDVEVEPPPPEQED